MENAAGAISDEIDVVTGDGITGEHTLSANKPEEGTTSFASLSKEQEEETVSTVEKIDKKKINEAEIPGNKISEDSSDAKKTAEMCMEKEEFQGLEDATNDETAAQTIQVEEPKEQSLTSAMPSENIEHGTTANEEEEEKVKGVEMLVKEINLEKEKPEEPEAVVDQETTVGQASITEESVKIETIGTIEKLDEDNEMKEAENLEDKICEDSSSSLQKEEPNELHTVPKERITSGQTFSEEQPDEQLHISTSAITSEEQEHETKKTEDKETNHEATVKDGISEDASDARTTEETCSQKERSIELAVEDAMTAGHTVTEKKSEEQAQNPTSTLPSKEVEGGNTSTTEKIESKKIEEAEFLQDDIGGDVSLQKERFQEDEALAKDENASSQTLLIEEQISNLVATLPLEEHKHETVNEVDKTEEEKVKEKEMQHEDSDVAKKVVEICSEKYETRGAQAALEGETIASQVITQESEEKKPEEAETLKDDKSLQTECVSQGALEDGATAAHTLSGENQPDQLHSTISTLPSEEQKDETKETELLQDESPEKITKQTREIEEASNVKMETPEKAIDNELLTESEDAARDETAGEENQCEKTNEGNEVILTEVSKEEVIEDKEVIETSYSTSHSGKLTKDGSAEDEPRDKLIEDLTNEALETTCQNEELLVEAQKSTENDTIEKQIVCENKTVEDPGQASVSGIEAKTVTEEASSIELSLAEGNQIIDDIQQPGERTNMASDKQIPKELDPIENTEITSSFGKEHAPIDLQERVAEPSRKAEVGDVKEIYPKQAEVDHGGETITDNSGEDITKESTTKVSSSNHIESSTKETLQVTQDTIEEREAKDENGAAQILSVEKPEEQSPAPSSKKPSDGASPQVEAVEEKEVEILYKDSSDTKTGEEICLAKDENKKVKTVVEQETIAVKAPPSEIKEDPVSPFEDGRKENELKDEDTLKVQTYEIQNEELCVETLKDGANDNIEKEIVAEDETVKEATTVREEIPGEAYLIDSGTTASLINKEHFPTEQQDRALVTSDKAEAGDMEPGNAQEICSEVVVDHGDEQKKDNLGVQITQEPASVDSAKPSLSGLHQRSTREKMQVSQDMIEERELRVSKEEPHVEEAKTEEKDGEEGDDHNKRDSGSDAPVMVEAPRDTDTKPHKKSQNILSGVGLKVKHSISKVKKAITGKSSHSKESKPISPKGSEK
ncbi:uncharacterized protein LOC111299565 [Durio zibethinus]|uniref:Uncharacterized protein LOC111299565 n=1 Tax=Durio zibethinus TaxID=66656 RepID=A0A6P5ZCK5_DURZI|nr:uncharacterized protein LOC111299565 [Durio zibethinus]